MSFKQYRTLDLFIWCVLYAVFEYLAVKAATEWFNEPYSISIMLPLLLIVMMRWDKYCIFQAIISAILFVLFQKSSIYQMGVYVAGNLGFMLTLFFLLKIGKEKVGNSLVLSELYALIGFLLMELFRGLASMALLNTSYYVIIEFILIDMLNLIFTFVVIFIVRRVKDLFIDQKTYLINLHTPNVDKFGSN